MNNSVVANQNFASNTIDELKKVTWPTRQNTLRLTAVVIIICLIIGAYIGIIDFLLAQGLNALLK